jgi:hypothetical protein
MNETDIVRNCIQTLEGTGAVRAELIKEEILRIGGQPDGILRLWGDWGAENRPFEVKKRLTTQTLPHIERLVKVQGNGDRYPLLLTEYVNPRMTTRLRKLGLEFVDGAGNLFVRGRGLFLWATGNKAPEPRLRATRAFSTTGLKLAFVLLKDPTAAQWTYRDLCEAAGIALGNVGWILGDLEEQGFLRRAGPRRRKLVETEQLRDRWEIGYAEKLRHKLFRRTYDLGTTGPIHELQHRLRDAGLEKEICVGGELGAAQLTGVTRPTTATLHTDMDDKEMARALRIAPARDGNITVLRTFGNMNRGTEVQGLTLADPLLMRAELLIHGDDRLEEMAEYLLRQYIR